MAMNAMQAMLKSMGLGDAFDGVQKLIASGAIEKIITFADNVQVINDRLAAIERELAALRSILPSCEYTTDIRSGNVGDAGGNVDGRYRPAISNARQSNGGN